MKFPKVKDIATKSVVTVNEEETVQSALSKMIDNNHRDIIVIGKNSYYTLTVNDIVRLRVEKIEFNNTSLKSCQFKKTPTLKEETNILEALDLVQEGNEYICIINEHNELVGILTNTDIISSIDPEMLIESYKLEDLIKITQNAKRANPNQPLKSIFKDLLENNIDCVLIVDNNDRPTGILTTKDILKLIENRANEELPLEHFMHSPVASIKENSTIKESVNFVKEKHFKRVIVVDDAGRLRGVIKQKELISMSFGNWVHIMKNHQ